METYFFFVWALVIAYIFLYNYIYLAVVLPALESHQGRSQVEVLPSKQLRDVDKYVRIQEEHQPKPWQYYPARYVRASTAALALLALIGLLLTKLDVLA